MLKLKIVSPEKIMFDGEVDRVLVPGTSGRFEILPNHAPIISALTEGTIEYVIGEERKEIVTVGGFVEVQRNNVNLCIEI